jgi:hypothetical protein
MGGRERTQINDDHEREHKSMTTTFRVLNLRTFLTKRFGLARLAVPSWLSHDDPYHMVAIALFYHLIAKSG